MKNEKKPSLGKAAFPIGALAACILILPVLFSCMNDQYPYYLADDTDGSVLNGLRWEIPCTNSGDPSCTANDPSAVSTVFQGKESANYRVTLRFRGVVEQKGYTGGINDGQYWQEGGDPDGASFNIYKLEISSPAQVFYLNRGTSGINRVWAIDYTRTVIITSGATITLTAQTIDGAQIRNTDGANPVLVPDVSPYPGAYNGQFVQMDVVSVSRE